MEASLTTPEREHETNAPKFVRSPAFVTTGQLFATESIQCPTESNQPACQIFSPIEEEGMWGTWSSQSLQEIPSAPNHQPGFPQLSKCWVHGNNMHNK